jgi:hypothetical protein
MASTIKTTPDSASPEETPVTPESSRTPVSRRVALWALALAAVAGVAALTVAVIGFTDDSTPNRPAPPVAETTETTVRPDPLISRFGRDGDQAPVQDPLITRFR